MNSSEDMWTSAIAYLLELGRMYIVLCGRRIMRW